MIIDCISDLHGSYPVLEGGDLLICAGDCTGRDKVQEWVEFFAWFKSQPYEMKVLVGGNHDGFLERCISSKEARESGLEEEWGCGIEYLCDSGVEFKGVKIWGSPWTPRFYNWHFMLDRGERMRQKWGLIPTDTDILVTHGPPLGILDKAWRAGVVDHEHIGCEDLANRILELKQLKLHVFGHIHEDYGECQVMGMKERPSDMSYSEYLEDETNFIPYGPRSVNCSIMNWDNKPINKPIRVVL